MSQETTPAPDVETTRRVLTAAKMADWQQVVLNGGPPCFHIAEEYVGEIRFCFRAERWAGHTDKDEWPEHRFVSLAGLLAASLQRETDLTFKLREIRAQQKEDFTRADAAEASLVALRAEKDAIRENTLRVLASATRKVLSPELVALVEAEMRRGLAAQHAVGECGNFTPHKDASLPPVPPKQETTACGLARATLHSAIAKLDAQSACEQGQHEWGAVVGGVCCRWCRCRLSGAAAEAVWRDAVPPVPTGEESKA